MSHPDHPTRSGAVRRRERGLSRVGTTTRWVTVAAAAGSVALATGYAQALPGKSSPPSGNTTRTGTPAPTGPASNAPAASRPPAHGAAPSKTSHPSHTSPHVAAPKRTTPGAAPTTHAAAPTPTAKSPTPTPQPSHTTSGSS